MINILGEPIQNFTYNYAPDFYVVTAYYNPMEYESRRKNYEVFAQTLRQSGIPLITVECAFKNQSFTLPESLDVIKVRSKSLLWQKERLLNLAISWLPKSCKYVAWLDCDLVFNNPNWVKDTVRLLDELPIVQVFETCHRLPQNYDQFGATGDYCTSFGKITPTNPNILHTGRFDDHGHTGYGWAARREILDQHGIYEHAILASADHFISHAIYGDIEGICVKKLIRDNPKQMQHFVEWATPFYNSVQGQLGVTPGEVMHLWHGDLVNRKYYLRHVEFAEFGYDPYQDVVVPPGKPIEFKKGLKQEKPSMIQYFAEYFASRQEDGTRLTLQAA